MITRRTLARTGALGLAGAIAAPRIARGETPRWRMVTSWPKRLPGPGMSAEQHSIGRLRAKPLKRRALSGPSAGARLDHFHTKSVSLLKTKAAPGRFKSWDSQRDMNEPLFQH